MLGYRCAKSGMTIAVGADHRIETVDALETILREDEDLTKMTFRVEAREGNTIRLEKAVAYHTSRGVPVRELADRCDRTLDRADRHGVEHYLAEQQRVVRALLGGARRRRSRTRCSSRRSGTTCSRSPRPAPGPTSRASRPRASPDRATRATTSGTPRSTSPRSSATPSPTRPATCCTSAPGCCRRRGIVPARWRRRCPVPLAHDQRRGGLRLLRGRHRPGAHRRRRRLRARAVRRRHR